jgi:hypothetical protein
MGFLGGLISKVFGGHIAQVMADEIERYRLGRKKSNTCDLTRLRKIDSESLRVILDNREIDADWIALKKLGSKVTSLAILTEATSELS